MEYLGGRIHLAQDQQYLAVNEGFELLQLLLHVSLQLQPDGLGGDVVKVDSLHDLPQTAPYDSLLGLGVQRVTREDGQLVRRRGAPGEKVWHLVPLVNTGLGEGVF